MLRYRCHSGHGFTADTLLTLQSAEVEQSLWVAVRLLDEQAELQRRMADRAGSANSELRRRFEENAGEREQISNLIRSLITGRPSPRKCRRQAGRSNANTASRISRVACDARHQQVAIAAPAASPPPARGSA